MQEAEKVVGCTEIQIKGDGILNRSWQRWCKEVGRFKSYVQIQGS